MLIPAGKETISGIEKEGLHTSFGSVMRFLRKIQGLLTRLLKDHSRRKLKGKCLLPDM